MTLYMKLGGRKAIMEAMPHLLARLETDPCFDLDTYRRQSERSEDLTEFLIFLSGGAPLYDGMSVTDLLSPICTGEKIYGRFVDHLVAVLVGDDLVDGEEDDLRQLMDQLRPHVLDPKPVAPVLVYAVEPELLDA